MNEAAKGGFGSRWSSRVKKHVALKERCLSFCGDMIERKDINPDKSKLELQFCHYLFIQQRIN